MTDHSKGESACSNSSTAHEYVRAIKSPDAFLVVRNLCADFRDSSTWLGRTAGTRHAVNDVSLSIAPGTTLGLVGESGSGKSTLARAILRLVRPASGSVWFNGVDVLAASRSALRRLRRDMQIVFQDPLGSLNPGLTIGQSIAEPLAIHRLVSRRDRAARVAELLDRVGLRSTEAHRYPHELSGGQRQRVGIARAISTDPKLLICDEPVSALDVSIQSQIINLLDELQKEFGLSYLFIAHDLAVVRHISDHVAVMFAGRIVETARSDDVFAHPRHPYTRALLAAVSATDPSRRKRAAERTAEAPKELPISGCAYRLRCPIATDRCLVEVPQLIPGGSQACDHRVACHHPMEFPTM